MRKDREKDLSWLDQRSEWSGLRTVFSAVTRIVKNKDKKVKKLAIIFLVQKLLQKNCFLFKESIGKLRACIGCWMSYFQKMIVLIQAKMRI